MPSATAPTSRNRHTAATTSTPFVAGAVAASTSSAKVWSALANSPPNTTSERDRDHRRETDPAVPRLGPQTRQPARGPRQPPEHRDDARTGAGRETADRPAAGQRERPGPERRQQAGPHQVAGVAHHGDHDQGQGGRTPERRAWCGPPPGDHHRDGTDGHCAQTQPSPGRVTSIANAPTMPVASAPNSADLGRGTAPGRASTGAGPAELWAGSGRDMTPPGRRSDRGERVERSAGRQVDPDPAARRVDHRDRAAVQLDHPARDGQPQPGTAVPLARSPRVNRSKTGRARRAGSPDPRR